MQPIFKGTCCFVVVFGWEDMVFLAGLVGLGSLGKSLKVWGPSENFTRSWVPFKNSLDLVLEACFLS